MAEMSKIRTKESKILYKRTKCCIDNGIAL